MSASGGASAAPVTGITHAPGPVSTTTRQTDLTPRGTKWTTKREDQTGDRTSTETKSTELGFGGIKRVHSKEDQAGDRTSATTRQTDVNLGEIKRATKREVRAGDRVSSETKSTELGLGGIKRATKREERAGDVVGARTSATAVTRDQGRLGIGRTKTTRMGREDEQGNLVEGREHATTRKAGLVAGDKGIGAFGSLGADATQAHGRGLKTTQSVGVDGQFTVDVSPVPGKVPPEYRITITITLGAKVAAGGSVEKGKFGATLGGTAEGSITRTFGHTYSQEAVDHYLGALKDPSVGGAEKELRVLQLAAGGDMAQARMLLQAEPALSSEAVKGLQAGDTREEEVKGKATLDVGARAQGSAFGASLGVSLSRGGSLRRSVTKNKDGKVVVTVEVLRDKGYKAGGSVSAYGVDIGGSHGETETTGESYTFLLDPDTDAATLASLGHVDSAAELRAVAGQAAGSVQSHTESRSKTTSDTAEVGVGGITLAGSDEHTYGKRTTTDKSGVTNEYTGATGSGLSAGKKDGPRVGYNTKDTLKLTAGPGNQGYGDVSTETSESSLGRSREALKEGLDKKPVATGLGLLTGGTPLLQEKKEVVGMKLSNDDFGRLAAAAQDESTWTQAFQRGDGRVNASLVNARRLRHAILAANGDRDKIADAFAKYGENNDNAAKFVQQLVRPPQQLEGGIRYDWPSELSAERDVFETLVVGDPVGQAETLATSGPDPSLVQQAVAQLRAARTQLIDLGKKINDNRGKFSDSAAVTEMLRRIGARRSQVTKEIELLEPASKGEPAKATPAAGTGEGAPPAPAADDAKAQEEAKAREEEHKRELAGQIEDKKRDLQGERVKEREAFAWIDKEFASFWTHPDWIEISKRLTYLHDTEYVQWDKSVADLKDLLQQAGMDAGQAAPLGPDRAGWKARRAKPELNQY